MRPDVVAGHSLGEYGAAYAAGCFDEEGLWLVAERDRFLAEAAEDWRDGRHPQSRPRGGRGGHSARPRAPWSPTTTPPADRRLGLRRRGRRGIQDPEAARCPSTSPAARSPRGGGDEKMRGALDTVEFRKPESQS